MKLEVTEEEAKLLLEYLDSAIDCEAGLGEEYKKHYDNQKSLEKIKLQLIAGGKKK
jgi:hypothetical protein